MNDKKNVENNEVINNTSPNSNNTSPNENQNNAYYHSNNYNRRQDNPNKPNNYVGNVNNNRNESLPKDDLTQITKPKKPKAFTPTGANTNTNSSRGNNLNSIGSSHRKSSSFGMSSNDYQQSDNQSNEQSNNSSSNPENSTNENKNDSNKPQDTAPKKDNSSTEKRESKLKKINNALSKGKNTKENFKNTVKGEIVKKLLKNPYVLMILFGSLILLLLLLIIIAFFSSESYGSEYAFSSSKFWWPIGSAETSIVNGKTLATGDPAPCTVTSEFGYRIHPVEKVEKYHSGIDIAPTVDTRAGVHNIIAAQSGTVTLAGTYGGYGNAVIIQHENDYQTLYGHLDSISISVGDTISQGEVIGKMGTTGVSTGTHLHFEVRENGNPVNPLDYISIEEPRPQDIQSESNFNFNLLKTSLTKQEFASKLKNYSYNDNYTRDFKNNGELIYDVCLKYNVNPELLVVTAQSETSFTPRNGYNYWGVGVYNDSSKGETYNTLEGAIKAYAELIHTYTEKGTEKYNMIINRYQERYKANCRAGSYGKPDTVEGMQSIYSSLSSNGSTWNAANCNIMKAYMNENIMTDTYNEMYYSDRCGNKKTITTCEYADYTYYQVWQKIQYRNKIFGGN